MGEATLGRLLADPASGNLAVIDEATGLSVSYRALADQVERLAAAFGNAGAGRGDAIALILPNGLEFLVVCLALARAGVIASPLDPALTESELQGFISDTGARAVVTRADSGAAAAAATGLAVPIWTPSVDASGLVHLEGVETTLRGSPAEPGAEDIALFLHTSGTEGKPKVVPLTHANVALSAQHIAAHYALTPADRSLVVLPLFHGHGLIGAALSTLASGGTVIVPPRFSASHFWQSFRSHGATWYTAVPTIHQILLERADANDAPRSGARFIRSCSAPIDRTVVCQLEKRLGAPLIEAYGLTEASHQVASNPLPPGVRVGGTVGFGSGTEIAIVDSNGRHQPVNTSGEVIVRGPTVMHGYRDNPDANANAFVDGWFRTGDTGSLDGEGYLTITGRIKDIINRGGEKISPSEIESVLLLHPAVAEAAAFPVPDPKYGEDVEAAVVLKGDTDAEALRSFCRERLASFKVPRRIRIVSGLPKNALGKLKRRALTELYASAP